MQNFVTRIAQYMDRVLGEDDELSTMDLHCLIVRKIVKKIFHQFLRHKLHWVDVRTKLALWVQIRTSTLHLHNTQ